MPKNRFPDSLAKRELRRQDARKLAAFQQQRELFLGLNYCGMPSVEFLDVVAWRNVLRSVCAVEVDNDVLDDMHIQWDILSLGLPIRFVKSDILDFLQNTSDCYDFYNLDFYGGFLNLGRKGVSRCIDALRSLFARHSARNHSFALITTFNVRDSGAREYLRFIDDIPQALDGWENVEECCKAHKKNNATLLKLCFPYFCWHCASANSFSVKFADPVVYSSSVTLVHFYAEFIYEPRALPELNSDDVLATLANRPLIRMDGMIRRIELRPPEVKQS